MARPKKVALEETPEEKARLEIAYAESRKKYTLAKVKKMFSKVDDNLVPFEEVIKELEQMDRKTAQ